MPTCPNCGNQTAENAVFCDQCGARLPAPAPDPSPGSGQPEAGVETTAGGVPEGVLICPDCGAENVPGELFCDVCGNPLEAPAPVSEPEIAAAAAPAAVEAVVEEVVEPETAVEEIVEEVIEVEPVAAPAQAQDVYCPTCGAPVEPGEAFCGNCGAAVSAPQVEVAPIEPIYDEEVEVVVEAAPVEEWEPQEILIEEVVVEEVVVEEAPVGAIVDELVAEPAEAIVEEVVVEPVAAAPLPEAAPLPAFEPAVPAATGPYLQIVDSGAHIPLVEQAASMMGRVDEVSSIYPDIDLTPHGGEEGGVSRRHAELQYEAGAWYVVDLDSTNGTFLNGTELQPKIRALLSDGDRIAMGELQVVFHD